MPIGEGISGAKRLRKVAKLWYRADYAAANAGRALITGYPAGLLRHHRVSAGAIASGKAGRTTRRRLGQPGLDI